MWNRRYAEPGFAYGTEPSGFLVGALELAGPTFEHLAGMEREVVEGRYHRSQAAVVQGIARR